MNEINSIDKLTLILNEFYHQSTSNFRKKEIERELVNFQSLKNSWEIINNLVNNSYNNQYLWFFSVSTVEVRSKLYFHQQLYCNFNAFFNRFALPKNGINYFRNTKNKFAKFCGTFTRASR